MKRLSEQAERATQAELEPTAEPWAFPVHRVRADFPLLATTTAQGRPLVYLDNAATTQKPRVVIDAVRRYYEADNANIHRGVYELSQRATDGYEQARRTVQRFLNAAHPHEIIFTRGTTESVNLVAVSFGRKFLNAGDEVLITGMEHHSNIVPWQLICEQTGAVLRVAPLNDRGEVILDEYRRLLTDRTRIVSIVHVSNSLGTINPVKQMIDLAHAAGAVAMIDGAQWVAHGSTDVQALDCDFYAFSGHKIYAPTGIGILYGKTHLLERMPPYQGGGDMIESVTFARTTFAQLPNKFEAGTPHISGAIGLAAALDYLRSVGVEAAARHEHELLEYATGRMGEIPGIRMIGTATHKAGVLSFVVDDPPISALDLGTRLDAEGIAVRTGHHCCQPVMDRYGIPATTRASLAMYNTRAEVDAFIEALARIIRSAPRRPAACAVAASQASLQWPEAAAPSPQAAADELAELFDMLGDRDEKNRYLLQLGEQLPHTFDLLRQITERVPGCMSEVYLIGRRSPQDAGSLQFLADANADIVRGLIAVLTRIYSGQKAADILGFDIEGFFRRIGLDQFISSQRRNGLEGMVRRLKSLATSLGS